LLINDINVNGVYHLRQLSGGWLQLVDPNGNGYRDPADVLAVIGFLNSDDPNMTLSCGAVIVSQYVDLGPITVEPGDTHVLVASVTLTSAPFNPNPVFLTQATATGDSNLMQLQDGQGNWVGMTWHQYKNMGISAIQLNPGATIQLNLYADIKADAKPGTLKFGLDNFQYMTLPGEVAQTTYSGQNTRDVNVVDIVVDGTAIVLGPSFPITSDTDVLLAKVTWSGNEGPIFHFENVSLVMSGGILEECARPNFDGIHWELPNGDRIDTDASSYASHWTQTGEYVLDTEFNVGIPAVQPGETWGLYVDRIWGGLPAQGLDITVEVLFRSQFPKLPDVKGPARLIEIPVLNAPQVIGPTGPITQSSDAVLGDLQFNGAESFGSAWFSIGLQGGNLSFDSVVGLDNVYLEASDGQKFYPNHPSQGFNSGAYQQVQYYWSARFDDLPPAKAGEVMQLRATISGAQDLVDVRVAFLFGNYTGDKFVTTDPRLIAVGGLG